MKQYMAACVIAILGATGFAADVLERNPTSAPALTPAPVPTDAAATNTVQPAAATNAPAAPLFDLKTLPSNTVFTVQLGAFKTRERAFAVFWDLSRKIPTLQLMPPIGKDKLYRVSHGSFPTYNDARAAADKLRKENIDCFVIPVGMPELAANGPRGD